MTNEKAVAEKLLQINAVQLSPDKPFTWASGWKSPIYCDNRKILSYPYIRDFIKSELCSIIFEQYGEADLLAGVATAGIPWGIMAADQLKLPFVYVRSTAKEHGMGNQIEGHYEKNQKVIVIEDLISTGKSSLQVCEVLQQVGLEVVGMVAIFTYGFDAAAQSFAKLDIPFTALTNYAELIELAVEKGLVNVTDQDILLSWRQNPDKWTGINGSL